jgi:glycosyltransferase involved in cell wall biosynthesis
VSWAGERPNAGRLVRAFDVVVLCSDYEGMPLAALEALVAGVPLVATAVGSLPELVSHGGGRVVMPGDARALADALAVELDELDLERNDRASASARELFGLKRAAAALQQVYDQASGAGR